MPLERLWERTPVSAGICAGLCPSALATAHVVVSAVDGSHAGLGVRSVAPIRVPPQGKPSIGRAKSGLVDARSHTQQTVAVSTGYDDPRGGGRGRTVIRP